MKKRFLLVLSVLVLVLPLAFSQLPCQTNQDCSQGDTCLENQCLSPAEFLFYCETNADCSPGQICLDSSCREIETPPENITLNITAQESPSLTQKVDLLTEENQLLDLKLTNLTSQIQTILQTVSLLLAELQNLNSQQTSLKTNMDQFKNSVNTLSTGLASLQTDLTGTQAGVTSLEEQLTTLEESRSRLKSILLFVLFLLIFAAAAFYILHYRKPGLKIPFQLKKHIHRNIKEGRSYPSLRKELTQAGWPEGHVDSAYKEVLAYNYQKYQQAKKPKLESKTTAKKINKEKIFIITVVSLIVLLGLFFLVQKGTGKAIQFQRIFAHQEPFICTPPHIVTEGGCCLDINDNTICDIDEEYEEERAEVSTPVCHDHRDCASGEICIDTHCGLLTDLYQTDCPGEKKCNINKIKILTSDQETYTLHAKKGSYTAAGALAWTIRPLPNYCQGAELRVPIEVEKSSLVCYDHFDQTISCDQDTGIECETDQDCGLCFRSYNLPCKCRLTASGQGSCIKLTIKKIDVQVLSKELITLTLGQASPPLTHPNPKINKKLSGFTLTLQDANEFCFS